MSPSLFLPLSLSLLPLVDPDVNTTSGRQQDQSLPRAASPQPSPCGDVTVLCFHGNHRLGRWRRGELSNHERANERGQLYRVIHGAMRRGEGSVGRPTQHLQLFPGPSLPSGRLQ